MSGIKVGLFHDLNAILDDDTLVGSRHPLSTQVIGFLLVAFIRLAPYRLDACGIERLVAEQLLQLDGECLATSLLTLYVERQHQRGVALMLCLREGARVTIFSS